MSKVYTADRLADLALSWAAHSDEAQNFWAQPRLSSAPKDLRYYLISAGISQGKADDLTEAFRHHSSEIAIGTDKVSRSARELSATLLEAQHLVRHAGAPQAGQFTI
jgi:hypothetical protein